MFEKIFDLQDNIIIVTDLHKVNYANKSFFRFFSEYSSLDGFNDSISDIAEIFKPIDEFGFIYKDMLEQKWNKKNFTWYEYVIFNSDKTCRVSIKDSIFNIRVSLLNDKEYIINLSEITELVIFKNNLLQELEEKNSELHQINTSLEGKLQEQVKELQKLNKELESKVSKHEVDSAKIERKLINESKVELTTQMMKMLAHQWKQPLTAINAYNQSIKLKDDKDILNSEHIDRATTEIKVLVHSLTDRINDFEKFLKQDDIKENTKLTEIVNNAHSLIDYALSQNSIEFEYNSKYDLELDICPNKLMQVILEVLQNAQDILIERDVSSAKIEIESRLENSNAIIEIKDNGGGVDENLIDKIFEPYYTQKKKSSKGMGLYMAKKIIENSLDGTIDINNSDHGATISIKLPINIEEEVETKELRVSQKVSKNIENEFVELFDNFNDSIENIQISTKINILDLFVIIEFLVWYEEFLRNYDSLSHFRATIANFINYLKIYNNPEKLEKLEANREELFNILLSMGDDLRILFMNLLKDEDIYNLDDSLVSTFHQLFLILNKKERNQQIEFF
jgi:signal transduction histidine kinase